MGHVLPSAWQDATVVSVTDVADRIRRITLYPERPQPARPGEHIDLQVDIDGTAAVRSYSVVDSSADGADLSVTVFHTPTSRGGSTAMHALSPGDTLRITTPQQDFPLRIGAGRYLLLAGGIGVTAMMGMAQTLVRLRADVRMVYVGRSRAAMAYVDELQTLLGDRLTVHADDLDGRFDVESFVDLADHRTELYMCGPIRLMDAVRRAWAASDLDQTSLRFETFGNSGWFDPEPFRVRIPRLGVETEVGPDESILEALERDGVEMMFDCRKGECGICQVKILQLEGQCDHRDVFHSEHQKQANTRMCVCVSRAVRSGESDTPAVLTIETT